VLRFPEQEGVANEPPSVWQRVQQIGPAIVTGSSNLDPSAVITATVVGAAFKLSLLWVVLLCIPFLLALLAVTARIGIQTRRGLFDLIRENYGRPLAAATAGLTMTANMCIVIADLMAVSDAFAIILNQPRLYFVAPIAFSVWYILIFRDYRKITLALVVVSLPLYVYVASAIMTAPPAGQLFREVLVPHLGGARNSAEGIVALFGAFLTPYIVLWQTSSRTDPEHEPHRGDAYAATLVSAVLAISVMVAAGSVLHLASPVDMTTREAAEALRPVVGDLGPVLFAIGIIGSGLVAIPVLIASMCYDAAQAMGWTYGLSEHPWDAKRFYVLISFGVFFAALGNFVHINPVKALYWSMVLAGVLTVPTFLFILLVANDRRIMRTPNSRWQNFWVGAATGGAAAATGIFFWLRLELRCSGAYTFVMKTEPVPARQEPFHRIVFENDHVRIFNVELPAEESTLLHHHESEYIR
jgi:Mn2+/Fe2+ NRAMP family transporter